ncbi:thioredoxin family protein [Sphingobacterium thalpophilum]|uniref:Thiol:disulfide interchange protein n=1 Tax=Sphingobacterium thalpophilum TaxID=259 RepID=A0A4U9VPB0_9SPHI|nr:thioredoxin family protein [Sphingobacterium thalpophilum]VTR45314.1 thiol:disulfide interchange protein precursor [Sphingobacterium thalpophilum]
MKRIKLLFLGLSFIIGGRLLHTDKAVAQEHAKVQEDFAKPYSPQADAQKDINELLQRAKKEHKNIIIQAGGNWCVWCLRFNDFIHKTAKVDDLLRRRFLYYHLNYSKENKNEAVFQKYAPEGNQLGYPFFIVLDKNGKTLHVQESGSLEKGKSYDEDKVLKFFNSWVAK